MAHVTDQLSTALADRYVIERELGSGGMALVYLARDVKHDRKVALKILRPELAAVIGAERFLNEIKVTANLQHPHMASAGYAAELGRSDPGRIVVDEVCGQLVALAFLPAGWPRLAVSVILFRFFDIIKPWPIRKLEKLPGGWGIMADDLGAGLAAAALGRLILLWI